MSQTATLFLFAKGTAEHPAKQLVADALDTGQVPRRSGEIISRRAATLHRRQQRSVDEYHRFTSDLLQAEQITDPFIRALTIAAREATVPILLGDHSVVSSGMSALAER